MLELEVVVFVVLVRTQVAQEHTFQVYILDHSILHLVDRDLGEVEVDDLRNGRRVDCSRSRDLVDVVGDSRRRRVVVAVEDHGSCLVLRMDLLVDRKDHHNCLVVR